MAEIIRFPQACRHQTTTPESERDDDLDSFDNHLQELQFEWAALDIQETLARERRGFVKDENDPEP